MIKKSEIVVYTPKITPRIEYIFEHLLGNILGYQVSFTTSVEKFVAFQSAKISYANRALGNEFFIEKSGLLDEVGFNDLDIKKFSWEGVPCFFRTSKESQLPFDVFSASFYLLARYEEYQPYVKDKWGAFPVEESLAFKHNFIHLPLVEMWTEKFNNLLQERFSRLISKKRNYQTQLVVNIDKSYAYANKNLFRQSVGFIKDAFTFRFRQVLERIKVCLSIERDPLDNYDQMLKWINKNSLNCIWFFQLGDVTRTNRNVSPHRVAYHKLIKQINDHYPIGLLFSALAIENPKVAKKEKKRLEEVSHENLNACFIANPGLGFPEFYNTLESMNIVNDFSLGYSHHIGFRANTFTPFYFYDLNLERATTLLLHPYVVNFKYVAFFKDENLKNKLIELNQILKKLKGTFRIVAENTTFDKSNEAIFKQFFKQLNE